MLNSIMLAANDYQERIEQGFISERNKILTYFDTAFSIIFLFEFISKIIAMGFFIHKNSYLRDAWNWLDFFIVMVSVISWLPFVDAG